MSVDTIKSKVLGRVGALVNTLTATHTKEARRMGCWSIVGEKSGAGLLVPGICLFFTNVSKGCILEN